MDRRSFLIAALVLTSCTRRYTSKENYSEHVETNYRLTSTHDKSKKLIIVKVERQDKFNDRQKQTTYEESRKPQGLRLGGLADDPKKILLLPFMIIVEIIMALNYAFNYKKEVVEEKDKLKRTRTESIPEKYRNFNISIPKLLYYSILKTDKNGELSINYKDYPLPLNATRIGVELSVSNVELAIERKFTINIPAKKPNIIKKQTCSDIRTDIVKAGLRAQTIYSLFGDYQLVVDAIKLYKKHKNKHTFLRAFLRLIGKSTLISLIVSELFFIFMDYVADSIDSNLKKPCT